MRTSTVLIGLLGGALFTAALVPPLFVALPHRFVEDWYAVSSQAALFGACLGLASLALTGFVAAMFAPDDAVRTGTAASTLSVLIGGILVALPAAEIEACAALLSMSSAIAADAGRMREVAADNLLDGVWVPAAVGVALLATGPALGAMGGVVFDLWRGTISRTTRQIRLSRVPQIGLWATALAVFGAATWSAHLDLTVLPLLETAVTWTMRNALAAPLLAAAAFVFVLLSWAMRDAVLLIRDERRFAGIVWALSALSASGTALVVTGVVHTAGLVTVPPWMLMISGVTAMLVGTWEGANSEVTFDPHPRTVAELIAEALLTGTTVAGVAVFGAGASAIGTYVVAFPYVRAVLERTPATDVVPVDLLQQVYALHWVCGLLVFVIAAIHLGLAVPLWVLARLAGR